MNYYNAMDGLNFALQDRWNAVRSTSSENYNSEKQFPNKNGDILEQYHQFEEYMNINWHPNVNLGAAVAGDQLLTDHGVAHVRSVILHAKDIIADTTKLNGYELFLLLMAIHFHDLGNISGREYHERKIAEIIEQMDDRLPLDTSEKEFIAAIAIAHGGYLPEDKENKDTIRNVPSDTYYDGVPIRPKALAAILRFADEISDDLRRSDFTGITIPHENEIYHEFSKALEPISIVGETIVFRFRIPYEMTQKELGKGNSERLLYDEILDRMAKCMRELEYCKKYANGLIKLSTIDVAIDILSEKSKFQVIKNAGDSFRLTLHGYPNHNSSKLVDYLEPKDPLRDSISPLKYQNGDLLRTAIQERKYGGDTSD